MPMHHHHHENKRDKANTRAAQVVKRERERGIIAQDNPLPLIDIGVRRIEELIKSVTGVYEDDYQDAWVRVLEEQPTTEDKILEIAKQARHKNSKERFIGQQLDISLTSKQKGAELKGTGLTLEGSLAMPCDGIYTPRILKGPRNRSHNQNTNISTPRLSQRQCQYCSSAKLRRYGIRYGKQGWAQRFQCQDCGRVFTANGAEGRMQYPSFILREFSGLRTIGYSFGNIQKRLYAKYNVRISTGTLFYWEKRLEILVEFKDMRHQKDKSQLILSLKNLKRNASLGKDDILTACGYSLKTKIEDTQLVKLGLLTKTKTGWLVNVATSIRRIANDNYICEVKREGE